jgi:hypothetical protein
MLRVGQPLSHKDMIDGTREKMGMDVVNHYNFGFPGISGNGKPSLIDFQRGLTAHDPGAAAFSRVVPEPPRNT